MTWLLGPGKLVGAFLIAGCVLASVSMIAYQKGRTAERTAILANTIQVMRERIKTNDTVRAMDDAGLCHELGGVYDPAAGCQ